MKFSIKLTFCELMSILLKTRLVWVFFVFIALFFVFFFFLLEGNKSVFKITEGSDQFSASPHYCKSCSPSC